jgi:hypothetical protein
MNINDILKHINLSTLKDNLKSAFNSLINLIEELSSENRRLKEQIQRLRDENNRLKGEQGKPDIKADTKKPNDISSEKDRNRKKSLNKKRNKRSKITDIKIDRTQKCSIDKDKLPKDVIFKGYKRVIVQDITIHTDNIEFKKEIYYSPSEKKTYIAPLPNGYDGEFGPTIKGLAIILKNICNMSESKIYDFFSHVGIFISIGKISNILIKDHQQFHQEKTDIVAAGLQTTIYQATDDTKARVNGQNYHTHILGNLYYTAYFTERQKNRLTVLNVLTNGKELSYCLNEHALTIIKQLIISKKHFKQLEQLKSENIFNQHEFEHLMLHHFSESGEQVKSKISEAAAIAAYRKGADHLRVKALLCDDAPQFKLICEMLALCWVHDGRHYKKLRPVYKYNATTVTTFLKKYWNYYHQLLDYKKAPNNEAAQKLSDEFDHLFSTVTGYNDLDERISKTLQKKDHLLLVLQYPEIPLHNNDMELGARVCVRKRDVSLHTMTDDGTRANDTFLTIVQTCKKLEVNPFYYIMDRIKGTYNMPSLALTIKRKHEARCLA